MIVLGHRWSFLYPRAQRQAEWTFAEPVNDRQAMRYEQIAREVQKYYGKA